VAIAVFSLILGSVITAAEELHHVSKLPIDEPWSSYNCSVRNDTITVVTSGNKVYLYEIVADSVVHKEKLLDEINSGWRDFLVVNTQPAVSILYGGEESVNLYQHGADPERQMLATKLSDHVSTYYPIPMGNSYVIVFDDWKKRFTLSSHNLSSDCRPLSYCEVRIGQVSKPKSITTGRQFSSWFQSVVLRDTVYAVWNQIEHRSFLTWVTSIRCAIVFARYDGKSWSKPEPVYEYEVGPGVSALGVYVLNERLYCFWEGHSEGDNSTTIYYASSADLRNWSAPSVLLECTGYLNRDWYAGSGTDGTLHLVIHATRHNLPEYYTFDGAKLEHQYDIELERVYPRVLSVDGNKPYLFCTKDLTVPGSDRTSRIRSEQIVDGGDTVSVILIDTSSADTDINITAPVDKELFLIEL
jgi:hypothetical protein